MTASTASVATDLVLSGVYPTGYEIGRGAYGRVFEVNYEGTLCAAKEVHAILLQYSQGEEMHKIIANFHTECHIWSTVRHPCVVQFLGTVLWSDRWWTIHSPIMYGHGIWVGGRRGYTLRLSSAKIKTPANRP